MEAIRKWLFKPKKEDQSLLAQFFFADEELNAVAAELDSLDGRKDPERCTKLVSRLRHCQDKVLNICTDIMDEVIFEEKSPRDFRVKFPDDVLQDNLSGQLWFGAECLAAGSSIINRESESAQMRPLAKAVTKSLDNVRNLLREQCFRHAPEYTEKIRESLKIFDKLFAEFELEYVSAMVPVKSVHEYDLQQEVVVLFSETLARALQLSLVYQESVENCDPSLMFTIPRLAIVYGLIINSEGPLNLDKCSQDISQMFRPFRNLLIKVKELLLNLSSEEITMLEQSLCSEGETVCLPSRKETDIEHYSAPKPEHSSKDSNLIPISTQLAVIHNQDNQTGLHSSIIEIQEVINSSGLKYNDCNLDENSQLEDSINSLSQGSTSRAIKSGDGDQNDNFSDDSSSPQDSIYIYASSPTSCGSTDLDNIDLKTAYHTVKTAIQMDVSSAPRSTSDLLHKLFVCISGVADQLQTNFAGDLRNILKSVFLMNSPDSEGSLNDVETAEDALTSSSSLVHDSPNLIDSINDPDHFSRSSASLQNNYSSNLRSIYNPGLSLDPDELSSYTLYPGGSPSDPSFARILSNLLPHENSEGLLIVREIVSTSPPHLCYSFRGDSPEISEGPTWIPDNQATHCMSCDLLFTVIRRKHHCRNCGKVFCSKCSSNTVPLPHIGHNDAVRVCNACFMFHVAPIFMQGAL